jgi:hypothetical protein
LGLGLAQVLARRLQAQLGLMGLGPNLAKVEFGLARLKRR